MKNLLIIIGIASCLHGCSIREYTAIVNEPVLVFDGSRVRYEDIPARDTIVYSAMFRIFTKGQHPQSDEMFISHRRYLLIGRDVKKKSHIVRIKKYGSRKYRQSLSFKSLFNYPRFDTNPSPSYTPGGSKSIHTGPRGGRYYINSNGNKTYIKK